MYGEKDRQVLFRELFYDVVEAQALHLLDMLDAWERTGDPLDSSTVIGGEVIVREQQTKRVLRREDYEDLWNVLTAFLPAAGDVKAAEHLCTPRPFWRSSI